MEAACRDFYFINLFVQVHDIIKNYAFIHMGLENKTM